MLLLFCQLHVEEFFVVVVVVLEFECALLPNKFRYRYTKHLSGLEWAGAPCEAKVFF